MIIWKEKRVLDDTVVEVVGKVIESIDAEINRSSPDPRKLGRVYYIRELLYVLKRLIHEGAQTSPLVFEVLNAEIQKEFMDEYSFAREMNRLRKQLKIVFFAA